MNSFIIERLPVDSFDWLRWKKCDIFSKFNFSCRFYDLISNSHILRKYAIGYIEGEKLLCRPKPNTFAILLLSDGDFSWFHLRREEFFIIFKK